MSCLNLKWICSPFIIHCDSFNNEYSFHLVAPNWAIEWSLIWLLLMQTLAWLISFALFCCFVSYNDTYIWMLLILELQWGFTLSSRDILRRACLLPWNGCHVESLKYNQPFHVLTSWNPLHGLLNIEQSNNLMDYCISISTISCSSFWMKPSPLAS